VAPAVSWLAQHSPACSLKSSVSDCSLFAQKVEYRLI
jgi:hypothetical protein